MAKVCTVETKVKLCGLYVREPFDYIFDEEDYNLFLRTFDLPESLMEYRKYLYIYGAFIRHQSHKCKTSEMQEEFRQQDRRCSMLEKNVGAVRKVLFNFKALCI